MQHGALFLYLKHSIIGFTSVYSDKLNKVIWTLLKVFVQTLFFYIKKVSQPVIFQQSSERSHLWNFSFSSCSYNYLWIVQANPVYVWTLSFDKQATCLLIEKCSTLSQSVHVCFRTLWKVCNLVVFTGH